MRWERPDEEEMCPRRIWPRITRLFVQWTQSMALIIGKKLRSSKSDMFKDKKLMPCKIFLLFWENTCICVHGCTQIYTYCIYTCIYTHLYTHFWNEKTMLNIFTLICEYHLEYHNIIDILDFYYKKIVMITSGLANTFQNVPKIIASAYLPTIYTVRYAYILSLVSQLLRRMVMIINYTLNKNTHINTLKKNKPL